MNIGEKYLPVGTVCLLQNGSKKVMITGFCVKSPDTEDRVFDYIGCLYPEGVISSDQNLLFDHSQIAQVFYMGYDSDEEKEFKAKLKEVINSAEVDNPTEAIINNDEVAAPVETPAETPAAIPTEAPAPVETPTAAPTDAPAPMPAAAPVDSLDAAPATFVSE